MKTYQDYQEVAGNEKSLKKFILTAIADYKASDLYKWALEGDAYDKQQNTTIMTYQKWLYTVSGAQVPNIYNANHKLASNFYRRFNVQTNQYLLGNGVIFNEKTTKDRLGIGKYAFDTRLQKIGKFALTHGVAYGFWNLDHVDVLTALNFVPLLDEENGALMCGIKFWQLNDDKPLRATLYEIDGYTEYIKRKGETELTEMQPKRAYKIHTEETKADGIVDIKDGENYAGFPIVPLWGNQDHICNIKAWKHKIDCYDLIQSGFANDVDDASIIYWTLENAGGMGDIDLAKFIERMKTVKAVTLDDDVKAEAHTVDVPVSARETYLRILEKDLYKDAMALDTEALVSNTTATAIRASYEPLNNKTDDYEYCVIEFIQGILSLAGIEDDPTFKRSTIVNQAEETQMVLSAGEYLDTKTILEKLPFIANDEIDDILKAVTTEEANRYTPQIQGGTILLSNKEEQGGVIE